MNDQDLLEGLVRIPSVTGHESDAVAFMQEQARRDGFRVTADAAGNFIAEAGHGPRVLLFVGHIDTVPGHIPVRVAEGELWGRGSVDAKGPLAAAYCAARRHLGSESITVRIVGAVDEEGDSRGARGLAVPKPPDWILIGEPSGVHGVTLGYKGILRGTLRLTRPRAHGAHAGLTATEQAIAWWHATGTALGLEDRFDALQGHLLAMRTESDGLTDDVVADLQFRLPPGSDPEELASSLAVLAAEAGATFEARERMWPALADKRNRLVACLLGAIRANGGEPRLLRKTGTADFNHLARRFPGIPIAAYGPGDAAFDHTPHERLVLADFAAAVDILDHVISTLATTPTSRAVAVPNVPA